VGSFTYSPLGRLHLGSVALNDGCIMPMRSWYESKLSTPKTDAFIWSRYWHKPYPHWRGFPIILPHATVKSNMKARKMGLEDHFHTGHEHVWFCPEFGHFRILALYESFADVDSTHSFQPAFLGRSSIRSTAQVSTLSTNGVSKICLHTSQILSVFNGW